LEITHFAAMVKDKPVTPDSTISVGEEVMFAFTIANVSQREVIVTNVRIDFSNQLDSIPVIPELHLKLGESKGFQSPKNQFTQPGNYVAYIVADQNGKTLRIRGKQDLLDSLNFTVK